MGKDGISVGEAITVGREVLMNMINEIMEELRPTMTLEDLQRVYSPKLDKIILDEEDASNRKYIGGEFNLDYVSDKFYTCGYKFFFQDEQQKIFKVEAKSRELTTSNLSPKVREQLKTDKNIKFEIPEPSETARNKHNRETFLEK